MMRSASSRVSNHEVTDPSSFETRRAVKLTQTAYTCLRGRSSGWGYRGFREPSHPCCRL